MSNIDIEFNKNVEFWKEGLKSAKERIENFYKQAPKNIFTLTLEDIGNTYSKKLANIMFDLGYGEWVFPERGNLEKEKQAMIDVIKDDNDLEDILKEKNLTKEEIFQKIKNVKEEKFNRQEVKEQLTQDIVVNFKNILSEMKEKDVKIILGIGNTMCIEDNKSNLYEIETYYHGSYLDKMIKNGYVATFNLIEKKQSKHLKKLYENKVEIFDYNKMKDLYENVVLVEYPELDKTELNKNNKIECQEKNRIFDTYKKRLLNIDNGNKIRFLSIEYLCESPKINPIEMAKSLVSSGCEIVFDDTSISQIENNKKRNQVYSSYYAIDKIENKDEDSGEEDCL